MLTGKRFTLDRATLALDGIGSKRRTVTVPTGASIKVVAEPDNGNGTVDVLWDGRIVEMFAIDVDVRGTEISESKTTA